MKCLETLYLSFGTKPFGSIVHSYTIITAKQVVSTRYTDKNYYRAM